MSRAAKTLLALVLLVAGSTVAMAGAEVVRKGTLQLKLSGELSPKTLPRSGKAPVAVSVGGEIETTDGSEPPKLKTLTIDLNKNGLIDNAGLPVCPYSSIQPGST